jgi:hypothetical protein
MIQCDSGARRTSGEPANPLGDRAAESLDRTNSGEVIDLCRSIGPRIDCAVRRRRVGVASKLRQRLTLRGVLIALGVAAAGITAAAILRTIRTRDREESDPASSTRWTPSPGQTQPQRGS